MQIKVKLYATFRKYAPTGLPLGESFDVKLPSNTIKALIHHLGIPEKERIIVLINGIRITNLEDKVQSNDLVVIFPLIGGG